jgi:hypothetical protein
MCRRSSERDRDQRQESDQSVIWIHLEPKISKQQATLFPDWGHTFDSKRRTEALTPRPRSRLGPRLRIAKLPNRRADPTAVLRLSVSPREPACAVQRMTP